MLKHRLLIYCILGKTSLIVLILVALAGATDVNYDQRLVDLAGGIPRGRKPLIVIDKSDQRLYYISIEEKFHFEVSFGRAKGKKQMMGDNKTPEGEYYICDIHRSRPPYYNYIFFGLSYPNRDDAKRGLKSGLISRKQQENIFHAIQKRQKPPWNTRLGGAIGIHGSTRPGYHLFDEFSKRFWDFLNRLPDLSNGCIMARNRDIDRLYNRMCFQMRVIIQK